MKNRFTVIVLLFILYGLTASALTATVSLPTVTKSNGEEISLPLTVTNFSNIGAFTFVINIDPAALNFIQLTDMVRSDIMSNVSVSPETGGVPALIITWFGTTPITIANGGAICNIKFKFKGTPSSLNSLIFYTPSCDVADRTTLLSIPVTYTNGMVNPSAANTEKAKLNDGLPVYGAAGAYVSVPLKFSGFLSDVGAITQYIHYDASKLSFVNATKAGSLNSANIASPSPGVIAIAWNATSGSGANINYNYPSNFIHLNFIFNGPDTARITFAAGCEIQKATASNYFVSYTDGLVVQQTATMFASLPTITGATYYNDYPMPVTFTNLDPNTAAFSLYFLYNRNQMEFTYMSAMKDPTKVNYSVSHGTSIDTLKVTWYNTNTLGAAINGVFMNLNFRFKGIHTANVTFGPGCMFTAYSLPLLSTLNVGYTNGSISPATGYTANAHLGCVLPPVNSNISVPITFDGLPTQMGAVTLYVAYDHTKLTYTNFTSSFGANVRDSSSHVLTIAWTPGIGGTNLNGTFLNLGFHYTSGDNASIRFIEGLNGPELRDGAANLVLANWFDGGANNLLKISGTLKYDSAPNAGIPLVGFTVTLKTYPGNVTKGSTLTDVNGYYEFWGYNGNYKIEASALATTWYADLDDVVAIFDKYNGTPFPDENALRITTADVNLNGEIDLDDVVDVFDKYNLTPNLDFKAPNWIFESPTVNCNCANFNQNIKGLNSGNVLGTNATPNQ